MLKFQHSLCFPFVALILAVFVPACGGGITGGGGNAETQASLPVPVEEDAGVMISSPSEGFVVVTAREAVPDGATVIADVDGGSALLDLLQGIMPTAQAATCSTTLPVCPEVDSDGKCQFTADADGSFTFQLPADVGNAITLSYLDTTTCAEVELFADAEVADDKPYIGFLVSDVTQSPDGQYALAVGSDSIFVSADNTFSRTPSVALIDLETHEVTSSPLAGSLASVESPSGATLIEIPMVNNHFFSLAGSPVSRLGSYSDLSKILDGTLTSYPMITGPSTRNSVFASQWPLNQARYLGSETSNSADVTSCYPIPSGATSYSRIYYTDDHALYFHEFGTSLTDTDLYVNSPTTYESEPALMLQTMNISIFGFDGQSYTLAGIPFMHIDYSSGNVFIVLELTDTNDITSLYFFSLSLQSEFYPSLCSGAFSFNISNGTHMRTEPAPGTASSSETFSEEYIFSYISGLDPDNADTNSLAMFIPSDQQILLFQIENPGDNTVLSFDSDSQSLTIVNTVSAGGADQSTTETRTLSALNGTVENIASLTRQDGHAELFVIGNRFSNSEIIAPDASSDFSLASLPNADFPIEVLVDPERQTIVIFDIGNSSDYTSDSARADDIYTFIKFYEFEESSTP